ncbi:MAG: DUF58 domain-containing protein, partial [Oscillospiraceae bacterium]|nr:DUF58 domain-containing protein [Oscillospiraceae bacterium]
MKAYITFLAALVVFFIFYNSPLSGTALALGIAVPAVMYTGLLITSRKLSIEVKLPSEPVRNGIPTAVITNRSIFAFPRIVLKAEYTHSLFTESHTAVFHTGIPAKSVQAVTVNSPVRNEFNSYCGTLRVHIKKLCLYDCFGIFKINLKAGQILSTDILPKFYEIDLQADLHTEETESNEFSQHIPGNDPSEVFAVREYREGDRVNTVHWKLSSRTDKLAVKQFSLPIDEGICLMPICVSDRRQAVPADKEKIKTERGLKRRGYRTAPARAGKENGEAAKALRSLKRRAHRAATARAGKEN